MQEIKPIGDSKYEVWTKTKVYDISDIEAEITRLQTELEEKEPTTEELIECGKATHPYYMQQEMNTQQITELQAKIKELKSLDVKSK